MMAEHDWTAAGHGWQGKETTLRLVGWSRQRRIVLLLRLQARSAAGDPRAHPAGAARRLSFAEVGSDREVWEYAALVTSLWTARSSRWVSCTATGATARMHFDELEEPMGLPGRLHDARPEALPTALRAALR